MDKECKNNSIAQASETGLGKTFFIGAVTPIISVACHLSRKDKPAWLTREFLYSARPLKNLCFALGLATGAASITGSMGLVGFAAMDEYSKTPRSPLSQSSPSEKLNGTQASSGIHLRDIIYIIPK